MAHRQQRDLVIETNLAFDDDARLLHAAAGQRVIPGLRDARRVLDAALALARGRHHGFDETRITHTVGAGLQFFER
jgi:hypothetical protein